MVGHSSKFAHRVGNFVGILGTIEASSALPRPCGRNFRVRFRSARCCTKGKFLSGRISLSFVRYRAPFLRSAQAPARTPPFTPGTIRPSVLARQRSTLKVPQNFPEDERPPGAGRIQLRLVTSAQSGFRGLGSDNLARCLQDFDLVVAMLKLVARSKVRVSHTCRIQARQMVRVRWMRVAEPCRTTIP